MSDKIICNCEIEDDEKQTYELTGHCYNCCDHAMQVHDEYADYKSQNNVPEGWECQDFPQIDDAVGCKWWDISSQGVIMEHDNHDTFYYIKPGVNVKAFMKGIEDYVKSLPPA